MLHKLPVVALYFWATKIMATTVGETAADFLSVTMQLGTAAGDLMAESFALGYAAARIIFDASFGDLLSQPLANGGLERDTAVTSQVFLAIILALVTFLTVTRRNALAVAPECEHEGQ